MLSRRGFSLPELLVVIAVLAILIGILLPVVGNARTAGKRIACRAQLSDMGRLFQMYLNDSKNKLPWVNPVPSLPELEGMPITELLQKYTKDVRAGWKCPADRITRNIPGTQEGFESYFEREGISYLYNPHLAQLFPGRELNDHPLYRDKEPNLLWLFKDFDSFHAPRVMNGSCNYLFADWHVSDLE